MADTRPGFLDKERIIAGPGFNRWLVPPAALAIHLCIGMAYGFSVFWLPLSKALSAAGKGAACPKEMSFFAELLATGCDWRVATLGWMYTLFFPFACLVALNVHPSEILTSLIVIVRIGILDCELPFIRYTWRCCAVPLTS